MKQPIMADGPRCKRRKQANPRRKNEDLQNLQKEISPTPSTPPIHPHDSSNEGFRQIYFGKHLWTPGVVE
ncbi:hypothetical protein STEG23_000750, partial [Scotinomys teguina]